MCIDVWNLNEHVCTFVHRLTKNTHTMSRFTITTTNTFNDNVQLLECTNENHRRQVASEIAEHYAAKPEFISVSQHVINGENVAIIHMTNGRVNMIFRQR